MTFFNDKIANRLGGTSFGQTTEIYKFEIIKRAKARAKKKHPELELIDMGVGEPDWMADMQVVLKLCEEAKKIENRWYADNGIVEFQEAAARYLSKIYHVDLNPIENIVHGIGSKSILAMLPICFINPGDIVLTTIPGYPVVATYARYLGGEIFNLPLYEHNQFLPDFKKIPNEILKKSKLLYINYPNNPTGAIATKEFFEETVEFALKNNIIVINDAAYGALTYGNNKPLSFLSIEGALEVGVEVHSLSKAFNMTGWRIGFLAGGELPIRAYATVKDNTDSGQFRAIQKAAIYALEHPEITEKTRAKYSRRLDLLVSALKEIGFDIKKPGGSFFCYVKSPKGIQNGMIFSTATQFSEYLIENYLISTVPWDETGHYLRFSVTFEAQNEDDEIKVISEMKKRLKKLDLIF
jgi:LL-diaminopimelate aminotransferase